MTNKRKQSYKRSQIKPKLMEDFDPGKENLKEKEKILDDEPEELTSEEQTKEDEENLIPA